MTFNFIEGVRRRRRAKRPRRPLQDSQTVTNLSLVPSLCLSVCLRLEALLPLANSLVSYIPVVQAKRFDFNQTSLIEMLFVALRSELANCFPSRSPAREAHSHTHTRWSCSAVVTRSVPDEDGDDDGDAFRSLAV